MKKAVPKGLLILGFICLIGVFNYFHLGRYFNLAEIKMRQAQLEGIYRENPVEFVAGFSLLYISMAAAAIPGATVLTLLAGFIFGFWSGLVIVSITSTVGATCAFLASRFLFRDFVQRRFSTRLKKIDEGIQREGGLYLLTLRLLPVVPFFLINLAMGLTPIRTVTFFFVSQIGMLPATAAYVNAGTQLSQINSLQEILSPHLFISFILIGLLPLVTHFLMRSWRVRKVFKGFKKPSKFDYNLVVIGAGSGGLVTAYIAAAVKAKVALIEKHLMGGDCLNTGCVPSKALLRSAKVAEQIRHASEFGINASAVQVDFAKVMERVQRIIKKIEPHDSVQRYTQLGVECVSGTAKILSPYEVAVGDRVLTTKNIVVATGAKPLVPTIPGLSDYFTSDSVWSLRRLPKRLAILGGGPIGCEMAQAFRRLGSEVILIEMSPRLLIREDLEVSRLIEDTFSREGIRVLTSHKANLFGKDSQGRFVICESAAGEVRCDFDEVLLALGRKANISGFGLEELGIELSPSGTILVNGFLQTKYPNIFACGDVAGPYQFTHTASHQAWYASVNALFSPFRKFVADYRVIPWCTFTDPEVAHVGLNEIEAKEKGSEYVVSRYGIDDLDRAITEGADSGFIKVLTRPGSDEILGVTIVADHAGDIIVEYVAAMKHGFGLNKILSTIHIYPTFAEANKAVAGIWKQKTAPLWGLRILSRFHSWRRG